MSSRNTVSGADFTSAMPRKMLSPLKLLVPLAALSAGTVLLFGGAACAAPGTQTTLYVSSGGSDSNDGRTFLGAFATITRAQEEARTLGANMRGDVVVEIGQGDYLLKAPLAFSERDSGTNGFNVIYKNHDAIGSARLLVGRKVTGWNSARGPIHEANIGSGLDFTTLYENGIRADLARWPKRTSPFATSRGGYMVFTDTTGGFAYADTALNPEGHPFDPAGKNFAHAWMYGWNGGDGHRWSSVTTAVVGATRERITAKNCGLGWPPDSFLLEGSPELLSRPGEYYYDRASGILSYYSRFPGRIENQEIIAPALPRVLSIAGTNADAPAHNLKFSGLSILGTDRIAQSNTDDWKDEQPSSWEATVYVKNARKVVIESCRIADTGVCGVTLDADAADCAVRGCLIEHTGYHGVSLKGGANNLVANCLIRYCGELRGHGSGVSLMDGTHTLSHLEIYYTARAGIAIRGKGDTVEYVKIHDCVQDSGDQGGIYLVDPASDAKFNQCTSFHHYVDLSCMDRPPTAIYNDRDAPNTVWSNIDCGDSQMYIFRHDPQSAGSTMTFDNVNWQMDFHATGNESTDRPNPRFDRGKMEYAKIGVTADFPAAYNDLAARPPAPLNLWAEAGDGAVALHWTESDRAKAYRVWRVGANGSFGLAGSVNVPEAGPDTGTSFTDSRLANGAPSRYVVTAVNKAGESPASLECLATPTASGPGKLTGAPIGGDPKGALAVDGNLRTYFESQNGWIGLDLGTPKIITEVRYAPRCDNTDTTARLCGGEFQGAVDAAFSHPTTLYKVIATKGGAGTPVLIPQSIDCTIPFRYVRFIGPSGKTLVAEIEFYGRSAR